MTGRPAFAVLFDRDGTLIVDVPYNGDARFVQPIPGVAQALDRLRAAHVPIAVVTNQSGVGRGLITIEQVREVNARVEELLGPFDGWFICPHAPGDGCECRKPKPKLLLDAARALGVEPSRCYALGDKQSDLEAARNAGAAGIHIDGARTVTDAVAEILRMESR